MGALKDLFFGSEEEREANSMSEEIKETVAAEGAAEGNIIDSSMLVGDIIKEYPDAAFALMQCGMGCISCPASQGESLEDASMVHGMNPDEVCTYVNEFLGFIPVPEAVDGKQE